MSGTGGRRRAVRAVRVVVVLAGAAAVLGLGAPSPAPVAARAADGAVAGFPAGDQALTDAGSQALIDAVASFPARLDAWTFRPVRPGGHGPVPVSLPPPTAATAATPPPAAPGATPPRAGRTRATSAGPANPAPRRAPAPAATTAAAPAAAGAALPLRVDPGRSTVVITVVAASSGATTATLTAWQRSGTGWTPVVGPVPARVGSGGVGAASETSTRTPAGTFPLTEAFGRAADPGTALPYRVIDGSDWWVSDAASPLYNRHTRCAPGSCPFDERAGENLWSEGAVYDPAVVIDYNRAGVPGKGSAFFLHVSNGRATAGCVAIDRASLVRILRVLTPAARPLIAIGVG